jgi:hypothetical protein
MLVIYFHETHGNIYTKGDQDEVYEDIPPVFPLLVESGNK